VYTPQSAYADLSGLNSLKPVTLGVHTAQLREGKDQVVRAFVQNPSTSLAFMVHLRIAKGKGGEDVVPVFWEDNYFSLLPGEKREVRARFSAAKAGPGLVLNIDGWNVTAKSFPLAVQSATH
jgi:exo-1,4-beta-D-glucosaminidase